MDKHARFELALLLVWGCEGSGGGGDRGWAAYCLILKVCLCRDSEEHNFTASPSAQTSIFHCVSAPPCTVPPPITAGFVSGFFFPFLSVRLKRVWVAFCQISVVRPKQLLRLLGVCLGHPSGEEPAESVWTGGSSLSACC